MTTQVVCDSGREELEQSWYCELPLAVDSGTQFEFPCVLKLAVEIPTKLDAVEPTELMGSIREVAESVPNGVEAIEAVKLTVSLFEARFKLDNCVDEYSLVVVNREGSIEFEVKTSQLPLVLEVGLVKLCEIESEPLVGAILDDLNVGGNDDVASTRVGIVFEVWSLVVA